IIVAAVTGVSGLEVGVEGVGGGLKAPSDLVLHHQQGLHFLLEQQIQFPHEGGNPQN
ncbi:hypothetical protein NL676_009187, partial [Syzygium grande]